jgi:hypothetical protein
LWRKLAVSRLCLWLPKKVRAGGDGAVETNFASCALCELLNQEMSL